MDQLSVGDVPSKDARTQEVLRPVLTNDSCIVPRDMFEKLYLSPQNRVKGDLRYKFANPTPFCLLGFLMSASPLACDLMGWRGAGGGGAASIGVFYFFGGLLQILGCVGEFILGNTFPAVVFGCYGAFWLSFGALLQPSFNATEAYAATGGAESPVFATTNGFWLMFMTLASFIFLLCSVRTNIVFVLVFIGLVIAFGLLTGAYWNIAQGNVAVAGNLEIGAGAAVFALCMLGWYLFAAQIFLAVKMPFDLPVGDLSGLIRARERKPLPADERA